MYKIYLITNLINQKKYVGITKNTIEKRWKEHIRTTRKKKKYAIHDAIIKHGEENFSIVLLEENVTDPLRECFWIEQHNTFEEGYNLTKGGDGTLSVIISEEERKNRSERALQQHKKKIIGMHGKTHSDETKNKIKTSHINLNRTGSNNPMFGKTHSEETKQKLRKPKSEETKKRMSESWKNKDINMSSTNNPMFGKKHSEETKQKIREARLKRTEMETS